jgi:transcriptional regulator with XRE-family HTH domain
MSAHRCTKNSRLCRLALTCAHGDASFAEALRQAILNARTTQSALARELHIDEAQVSRWVRGKAVPKINTVHRIEEILHARLIDSFSASTPDYELYVSAPIVGLGDDEIAQHQDAVAQVVYAARQHVNNLHWSGEQIRSRADLAAADLHTARKLEGIC